MKKYQIKFKDAAPVDNITIGDIILKLRRNPEYNEWIVKVYRNGKYSEDESYYTDDKQDAIITMNRMAEDYKKMTGSVTDAIEMPINDKANVGLVYKELTNIFGAKLAHDTELERLDLEEVKAMAKVFRENSNQRYVLMDVNDRVNYAIMNNRVIYSRFERSVSNVSLKSAFNHYANDYGLHLNMSHPAEVAKSEKLKERRSVSNLPEVQRSKAKQHKAEYGNAMYRKLIDAWERAIFGSPDGGEMPIEDLKPGEAIWDEDAFYTVKKVVPVPEEGDFIVALETGNKRIIPSGTEVLVEGLKPKVPNFKQLALIVRSDRELVDGPSSAIKSFLIDNGIAPKIAERIYYEFRNYVKSLMNQDPTDVEEGAESVQRQMNERVKAKNYRTGYWNDLKYTDKNGYEVDLSKYLVKLAAKVPGVPSAVQERLNEVTELYNSVVDSIFVEIENAAKAKDWPRVSKFSEKLKTIEMASIRGSLKQLARPETYQDVNSYEYMSESQALTKLKEHESVLTRAGL